MTGASGAIYAVRLLEVLLAAKTTVHLTLSPAATQVLDQEMGLKVSLEDFQIDRLLSEDVVQSMTPNVSANLHYHHYRDFHAGIASGSFPTDGMVVCPCSGGTLAAVATGQSQNLIHRAADVHLKERRKLVIVPRETPLSVIALGNMHALAQAGAVILPAMPGFYHGPQSISDLVDFVVGRICDQLGVTHHLSRRWGSE